MTMKTPVLQMKGVTKSFGGLRALIDVDLELYPDEILAIVGDNGAGKSTLIKVLTGIYQADSGTTELNGQPANIKSRQDSLEVGIATVYQDLGLVDTLSAAPNIFLGDEPKKKILGLPFIDNEKMRRDAEEILHTKVGVALPNPDEPIRDYSGGQRQAVAIARAVRANDIHVLVMDEPTAALGPEETKNTLELIKTVRGRGTPIILISHNLDHVFSVADRVQVMRGGMRAGVVEAAKSNKQEVLGLIVGSELQEAS